MIAFVFLFVQLWEYREHLRELKENDEDDENVSIIADLL